MKKRYVLALLMLVSIFSYAKMTNDEEEMILYAKKIPDQMAINADWEKEEWKDIEAVTLKNYMGEKTEHFPKAMAKVGYDDNNIYLIFKVEDQYVRAVAKEHQGGIWEDSTVEFFFSPDSDVTKGYFNLEVNCGGKMYFQFQEKRGVNKNKVTAEEFEKVEVAHTMPEIVDPEIKEPTTWFLEIKVPLAILSTRAEIVKPQAGTKWRCNFQKCGEKTSHPHYLTWNKIDYPKPNFHMPEFFGTLIFE